jgi:hypothetical protein
VNRPLHAGFALAAAVSLLVVGCSSDDPDVSGDEDIEAPSGSTDSGEPLMSGDDRDCTHVKYENTCDQNEEQLPVDENGWTGNQEVDGRRVQEEMERRGIKP